MFPGYQGPVVKNGLTLIEDRPLDVVTEKFNFCESRNAFSMKIRKDLRKVRSSEKPLPFTNKTLNIYRLEKGE